MKPARIISLFVQLLLLNATALQASTKDNAITIGKLTSAGSYFIEYTAPNPIPLNKIFTISFRVLDKNKKNIIKDVRVTAQAWMPEHNHGTTLQPKLVPVSDGTIKGEGFLLHMEGNWELRVGVLANGQMERAIFDIQLQL